MNGTRAGEEGLKSLTKIMRVLESFSTVDRALSLSEICRRTGFPKSTAHRLVASMREVGLLDQDGERDRYRLGLKLFNLGNIVLANMDLHREARPHIENLRRLSGQAVHLAVFDGRHAVVVDRLEGGADSAPSGTIETAAAHCTGVGKAILAFQTQQTLAPVLAGGLARFTEATITDPDKLSAELAATRERGYSIDEGEHQPGLRCIGAPIRDQTGHVIAAVSVSGPTWRVPASEIVPMSRLVIHAAEGISRALGWRGARSEETSGPVSVAAE
ncbi:MAG: IclR family transcriptional regulator [Acetobacteraceae bacterium]|nr:IclR family transcriptional regulator [Acetobacteraceae bacterium]